MLHDVFICHASEDKNDFVRPLAEALRARHLEVWYDEFSLQVGDSLRAAIDRGLANSRFGVVVLSPAFFRKRWTQRELNGLVAREMHEGRELVLPIWHNIGPAEIIEHSPPLADVLAANSSTGLERVVSELLRRLRPDNSPLLVARDFLIEKGVVPPIVTDEWWLNIVEFKESQLRFPDLNLAYRWIFPLPHDAPDYGEERGINIAWTALQLDWLSEVEHEGYCQLTHPERVHTYIRKWPGLFECCRANPELLALYAPQLTIPGYDDGFADVLDASLQLPYQEALHFFRYSRAETLDAGEPLCGDALAWRHPGLGNFSDGELAYSFVHAHTHHYTREFHTGFTCLIWLLADASNWLPDCVRSRLLNGMRTNSFAWIGTGNVINSENEFHRALLKANSRFKFSRSIMADLESLIDESLKSLSLSERSAEISRRFIKYDFIGGYYDQNRRLREGRRGG
ncbi:toll/interleukin-1 receptor domain-containing protein [Bradyrhizobium nitroreducens]|uniref:toll/interleukin-1 receptor domain-containing protein n=1 Tax=Bradyrhizobium nitroreducens TaxID=709803 RepID=UPI001AEF7094|nr:TIR domain-containing protein [Bradyrhizobium nitroreducens]